MHYSSQEESIDKLEPVLHRLYCKMQSEAGAKSLIIGEGSKATFFPTGIQWDLARHRPTMSIVLSEDELAWK